MHAIGKYIEPITKKQFSESAKFDIHFQLQKVNIKFTTYKTVKSAACQYVFILLVYLNAYIKK